MLKIVMAKPMQFAMVSAEPTYCRGALCALRAENWGESPTTTTPQNSRKARSSGVGAWNSSGESAQHAPEAASWAKATRALPTRSDNSPPKMQPRAPAAMTAKLHKDTSKPGFAINKTGANAQNAYSSHM